MIIDFKIKRETKDGEQIFIMGSSPVIGHYDLEKALPLKAHSQTLDTGETATVWSISLKIDPYKERLLSYKYFSKDKKGKLSFEAGGGRRIALNSTTQHITTIDDWQENNDKSPFLSDPFAYVFYGAQYSPYTQTHKNSNELIIRAVVPNIPHHCRLVLYGNCSQLGHGKPEKGIKMARLKGLKWIASINTQELVGKQIEYKFAIIDDSTKKVTTENPEVKREIIVPEIARHQTLIIEHSNVNFDNPIPKFAGVTIPLFALKSKSSCGIGEIYDLKLLIDWAEKCGIKVVNLLPINDTTRYFNSKDSSPYNCISSIAINPIYLSLSALPKSKNVKFDKDAEEERRSLNRRASVDYEDLFAFKKNYFRTIYEENKEEFTSHPNFYRFIKNNKEWLYSYALFCALRDHYRTPNFKLWERFSTYSQTLVDQISSSIFNYSLSQNYNIDMKKIHADVHYYVFLQFVLYNQMQEVIHYAHSKGIALSGELPMYVCHESVDAWKMPYLFDFQGDTTKDKKSNLAKIHSIFRSSQTGSSAPIFKWDAIEKENYLWWVMRVRAIHNIYDIYSIGRIGEQSGVSDNESIAKMLPLLVNSSNLLVCGKFKSDPNAKYGELAAESEVIMKSERLRKTMDSLKVLSLELPDIPSTNLIPEETNYLSVAATSTCNSRTLRMWLGEELKTIAYTSPDDGKTYYDATAQECKTIVAKTLATNSMLANLPLQDWMSIDENIRNRFTYAERINDPNVVGWVWKYRMHISLEDLLNADSLNEQIRELITSNHRI